MHHDDADREYAYDRESHIGKLDTAWDKARIQGWRVVSMKDDWNTIFPNSADRRVSKPEQGSHDDRKFPRVMKRPWFLVNLAEQWTP